ncbi:MAG TPA: methyltransferase domain-containing protein [Candidatus Polarisedimenticolia bacterium]|nr:methyltransferase domain-containing protein [Candidatus Polarisedimenticolia bacterium]
MCSGFVIEFGRRCLTADLVAGRDVVEVGAFDVNGSLRPIVEALGPRSYVGVDITAGPGVDRVMDARNLVAELGPASADIVISTEMVEHVLDWHTVIQNLKGVLRPGGRLLLTTRSKGFGYHAWPYDFWRYELDDMRAIFGDMELLTLEPDPDAPGVFVFALRSSAIDPVTPELALYSMLTAKRQVGVSDVDIRRFAARAPLRALAARLRSTAARSRRSARSSWRFLRRRVVSPLWMAMPRGVRRAVKRLLGRA